MARFDEVNGMGVFAAIAQARSFTAAGDLLSMSQARRNVPPIRVVSVYTPSARQSAGVPGFCDVIDRSAINISFDRFHRPVSEGARETPWV